MGRFIVIPAIDLKGGKCVRLRQGREDDSVVYLDDPVEAALRWVREGAEYIHVVDLDGAFRGRMVHLDVIRRIVDAAGGVPVEVGGGLRTDEDIASVLDAGVSRAILGTRALAGSKDLSSLASRFGGSLAVGIDARDGFVQVKGWVETTSVPVNELAASVEAAGIRTIIYTDTSRDGMMRGVNIEAVRKLCCSTGCSVVASGGISSCMDVECLVGLDLANLEGGIVGKALYEGVVSLGDMMRCAASPGRRPPVTGEAG